MLDVICVKRRKKTLKSVGEDVGKTNGVGIRPNIDPY